MNAEEFTNLYKKQSYDESITSFSNELGFSLIRFYPNETQYYKDNKRMFIKVGILDRGFFYSVEMTAPKERGGTVEYVINDETGYRKGITNFVADLSDGGDFFFDENKKNIIHKRTKKELSMNEFVEILENNHLTDRLFWKRLIDMIVNYFLKGLFWLSNQRYDKIRTSIDRYRANRGDKIEPEKEINSEPFFKYFSISKNFIFATLLLAFLVAILSSIFPQKLPLKNLWHTFFGEFSASNPMVILLFFLGLFTAEKISVWLNREIRTFLVPDRSIFPEPKKSLIESLHEYQHKNKFDTLLNLPSHR